MIINKFKLFFVALLLPITILAQECQIFTDISNSNYKNDILYASNTDQAWVNCDTTFRPTEKTKKIEALKMTLLAGGNTLPSTDDRQCFDDVPTDSWMNIYVCYGKDNGFLVNRDKFNPEIEIDFAKASKLILKTLTDESYSEDGAEWHDDYLAKMALYGFNLNATDTINRDYFLYMLREVKKDPNKEAEVIPPVVVPPVVIPPIVEPPVVIPPVVLPPIVDVVTETAIDGFEHWFEPYRCFDSIIPILELKIQSNTLDANNNRILDLEYDTSGGSQSCVDTEGDSHTLAFGTRWRAENLVFGDLTAEVDKRIYKYKKVRVTVPSGKATEIRLAVITTLGKVMVKTLFVDAEGNVGTSQTTTYGLNGISISDPSTIAKIKLLIADLERIKLELEALLSSPRSEKKVKDDDKNDLKHQYDDIKKRIDNAKKLLKDVKKALKGHKDEKALEKEINIIDKALNDIKKKIDGYKKEDDNSVGAIDALKSAVDEVIAMMVSDGSVAGDEISLKAGRNTVSGNISVKDLNDDVHSMFILNDGNWYGYSPHADILKRIERKYMLIEDVIGNHKGALVYAIRDTTIKSAITSDTVSVTHTYPRGYTLHGTDGDSLGVDDIVCEEPHKLIIVAKVRGDVPSVYVPDKTIDGIDNFEYLYANDGYFVLCDKE